MNLLSHDLEDLRRRTPSRKLSAASGLKIALQVVQVFFVRSNFLVFENLGPSRFTRSRVCPSRY